MRPVSVRLAHAIKSSRHGAFDDPQTWAARRLRIAMPACEKLYRESAGNPGNLILAQWSNQTIHLRFGPSVEYPTVPGDPDLKTLCVRRPCAVVQRLRQRQGCRQVIDVYPQIAPRRAVLPWRVRLRARAV